MDGTAVKRFIDIWNADEEFRRNLATNYRTHLRKWNLDVDIEALRVLWNDGQFVVPKSDQFHPAIDEFHEWQLNLKRIEQRLKDNANHAPNPYRKWRERQIHRFTTQSTTCLSNAIGHFPYTIEVSRGCSVGCSYCGLAAPALDRVARFDKKNENLFRSILTVLNDFFAESAKTGFLYWATEPLDNKDYEKYLYAFYEQFGVTPQTTTAAWGRNIKRTKQLLAQSKRCNGILNRFSINSLEELSFCLEKFTAEELMDVILVPQNPGSTMQKVAAGRGVEIHTDASIGTIACVTGFLINLVDQHVKLISPCTDLEKWPLGYSIFRESHFNDAGELRGFLKTCEEEIMSVSLDDDLVLNIREDLAIGGEQSPIKLVLSSTFGDLIFDNSIQIEILRSVDGQQTVGDIVQRSMENHDPALIYFYFNRLYDAGLFEDLPKPMNSTDRPVGALH
jgi:radical SAM family RiPP maturation amino acid epimerase